MKMLANPSVQEQMRTLLLALNPTSPTKVRAASARADDVRMDSLKTPLSKILTPLNANYGKVSPGWGTAPLMLFFMFLFAVFLVIILQIYNSTLLLENVNVDWTG